MSYLLINELTEAHGCELALNFALKLGEPKTVQHFRTAVDVEAAITRSNYRLAYYVERIATVKLEIARVELKRAIGSIKAA